MIEEFKKITGYDLSAFFSRFVSFVDNNYNSIVSYYSGNGSIGKTVFNALDQLISDSDHVNDLFSNNIVNLSYNVNWWEILEQFEDARDRLLTIKNSPKWFRSYYINDYDSNINVNHITKDNQNIEDVANIFEYNDPQNDWIDLSIKNDLSEGDYSNEGGVLLKATFANNRNVNITSVVDVMTGLNILGKDIDRDIIIADDDLQILEPSDTITQAAKIKLEIRKGSVPEFPEIGIPIMEGSSYNFLRYPVLFRNLVSLFGLDDTFKSIEITDIRKVQDAIYIDLNIKSKIDSVTETQSLLV